MVGIKVFFVILKGFSLAKNCHRPESTPLKPALTKN